MRSGQCVLNVSGPYHTIPIPSVGARGLTIVSSGLPAYDPYVIDLGLDPAMVDSKLREDHARLISMGYNVKCKFMSVLILFLHSLTGQ